MNIFILFLYVIIHQNKIEHNYHNFTNYNVFVHFYKEYYLNVTNNYILQN